MDSTYCVVTINASQRVTKAWGISEPDITFMMYNQIEGVQPNARAVRSVLNGERTKLLYMVRWEKEREALERGLAAFNYGYDDLRTISRVDRMALHEKIMGSVNMEVSNDTKFSTGMIAIMYAVHSGAKAIIISGIDPDSSGHVYNDLNLRRQHAQPDKTILTTLRKRGFGLYTADPEVARTSGLPLWAGNSVDGYNEIEERAEADHG